MIAINAENLSYKSPQIVDICISQQSSHDEGVVHAKMPFSHSGASRTFPCNDANTSMFHQQARPSRPCPDIGGKIRKESAVNHKEINTNGVNRMLLRRP